MRSVASTRVCSSMSTVTVVPASRAAAQIRAMFSVAVFSPCSARPRPTAVGLTDTSARPPWASPAAASWPSSPVYSAVTAAAWSGSLVSSPRWSRLTSSPLASRPRVTWTASAAVSPATYRATRPRVTGAEVISCRVRSLPDAASSIRRSTIRSSSSSAAAQAGASA